MELRTCFFAGEYRDDELCLASIYNTLSDPLVDVIDLDNGVYKLTNLVAIVQSRHNLRSKKEMMLRVNITFST